MKSTKIILAIILITCCCISCKEKVSENLQISIENRTDCIIHVKLYPKVAWSESIYPMCENCGGLDSEFILYAPKNQIHFDYRLLYFTSDLNIKPYTLASNVFDSICIKTSNNDSILIKFTHKIVTGYSENIFSENSTWDFEVENTSKDTQLNKQRIKINKYNFLILTDKIINKEDKK